ncbi:MAG TPA: PAS domain S-box protein [Terriglobales bacterium]|nr:PAS domain S-box protein [Terriglobales bacterium]
MLPQKNSDDARFQELLLEFSSAASRISAPAELLRLFCRVANSYFGVSGTYIWHFIPPDQLVAAAADGWMAAHILHRRLKTSQSAVAVEAIQNRRAVFANSPDTSRYPMAAEFQVKAVLAAPLIVSNEVIGAVVLVHNSEGAFFNQEHAARATILAAQLSSLLEAARLSSETKEEKRRAEILAEVAQSFRALPDSLSLIDSFADGVRALLRTSLVCILGREATGFELWSVATEDPALGVSIRARQDRKGLHFASDIASRAIAAGDLILVSVNPASHFLGDVVPSGTLLAVPFRTSTREGAVLVYPRGEGPFTNEEKKLLPVITSFAALAIANSELYSTARGQAQELQQIVSIASELGSISDLDQFMRSFIQRASEFLGFERAFVGLIEGNAVQVRWSYTRGEYGPPGYVIPEGVLTRAIFKKEVFWSDSTSQVPGTNTQVLREFNVNQLLAVPLLAASGDVLGVFGVLDQNEKLPISQEDVRRAQALAAHMTAALEVSRNLLLSERHRKRSESLTELALEMSSLLRGPDMSRKFLERAAKIMGASDAALVTQSGPDGSAVVLHSLCGEQDTEAAARFSRSVLHVITESPDPVLTKNASELLGEQFSTKPEWNVVVIARLWEGSGEPLGALCLAGCKTPISSEDQQLLKAIAGEASVSLENARFFTRMEQANRHWVEIFDAIADFIVAHDESGNVLRVNRALADFIGVQPAQLIGLNMATLLGTSSAVALARSCPFCRPTGELADEYVHPALERTFLVSTSQVHAASSEGLQTVHVLKDITDRREAERRYRDLFDNIQEGLFFCSPDGRFIEVNDALVRMLGRSSREELLHCDPRQEIFQSAEQHGALFAEMERQGALHNRAATLKRKDGSAVHVLINAFAVYNSQGQISQFRGLILDITGLKAYQTELQKERDFSGKILNNTQSLILVVDTAGLVSYANRRWQAMGYEQEGIIGRTLESLVAPANSETFCDAYSAVLSGDQVDNLELQILRADRRVGQFSVNMSPMRDDHGQVSSIVVVMSDVTDAASLQAKLMHTEKMAAVGQLVSGVAHEVNNPLTAILGFADLLMEAPDLPEAARKDLRVILQEAQRTKQIVQNLLSFARQMPPQRKPIQLNPILKRTLQLRAYDLQSRGVSVTENLRDHLPLVIGDSHQLQQVFLNILNNAYDAVRDNVQAPRIEVATSCTGDAVEITFRDNGAGVSQLDRIFDPFFTTKQVGEGTGLGLSICYGIVKEHGGEIFCENNSDGPGATFVVRLPGVRELASISAVAGVTKP